MRHIATIAAIATAPGEGAIGIVRLSGPMALGIAEGLFRPHGGGRIGEKQPFLLTLGKIVEPLSGSLIDEVFAVAMPGPHSYTGEDTVEFQAHGGTAILERILRAVIEQGARPAVPGEFTRRAFLNGRLDLAQAEAVIDLIQSRSAAAAEEALHQLGGRLSKQIAGIRTALVDLAAELEAALDFSEEDGISPAPDPDVLQGILKELDRLLESYRLGGKIRRGFQVTFTGRPNVGKSSIINGLLNMERSIVTPVPGTTRDTVESRLRLGATEVLLVDTAGIGPARDEAEAEGIRRSRDRLAVSDLAVIIIDSSVPLSTEDRNILKETADISTVIVLNKSDLPSRIDDSDLSFLNSHQLVLWTSALTGDGIEALQTCLEKSVLSGDRDRRGGHPVVTSARHEDALRRARTNLVRGVNGIAAGETLDMAAADLQGALRALGEISGETATEDILDRIFRRFCIGK